MNEAQKVQQQLDLENNQMMNRIGSIRTRVVTQKGKLDDLRSINRYLQSTSKKKTQQNQYQSVQNQTQQSFNSESNE